MNRLSLISKLLCLVFLPFALFGGPVTLLCLGAEGHLAIETSFGSSCFVVSDCSHAHDHEHGTELGAKEDSTCGSHENCCGDCVDIELELDDVGFVDSGFENSILWMVLAMSKTPWVTISLSDGGRGLPVNKDPPGFRNSPLESFSTIRLLI